jgi:hypothetical protein
LPSLPWHVHSSKRRCPLCTPHPCTHLNLNSFIYLLPLHRLFLVTVTEPELPPSPLPPSLWIIHVEENVYALTNRSWVIPHFDRSVLNLQLDKPLPPAPLLCRRPPSLPPSEHPPSPLLPSLWIIHVEENVYALTNRPWVIPHFDSIHCCPPPLHPLLHGFLNTQILPPSSPLSS